MKRNLGLLLVIVASTISSCYGSDNPQEKFAIDPEGKVLHSYSERFVIYAKDTVVDGVARGVIATHEYREGFGLNGERVPEDRYYTLDSRFGNGNFPSDKTQARFELVKQACLAIRPQLKAEEQK